MMVRPLRLVAVIGEPMSFEVRLVQWLRQYVGRLILRSNRVNRNNSLVELRLRETDLFPSERCPSVIFVQSYAT
jgi:hypothetical protein